MIDLTSEKRNASSFLHLYKSSSLSRRLIRERTFIIAGYHNLHLNMHGNVIDKVYKLRGHNWNLKVSLKFYEIKNMHRFNAFYKKFKGFESKHTTDMASVVKLNVRYAYVKEDQKIYDERLAHWIR